MFFFIILAPGFAFEICGKIAVIFALKIVLVLVIMVIFTKDCCAPFAYSGMTSP